MMRRRTGSPPAWGDLRLLSSLEPLRFGQWLRYLLMLVRGHEGRMVPRGFARWPRDVAWWLAVALLAVSPGPRDPVQESEPLLEDPGADADQALTTPVPALADVGRGFVVRDKRKFPRDEPKPLAAKVRPVATPMAGTASGAVQPSPGTSWAALIGMLLTFSGKPSVPGRTSWVELGRQVRSDTVRRAVVLGRRLPPAALPTILDLAADEDGGDWRVPVALWAPRCVSTTDRVDLIRSTLLGGWTVAVPDRKLNVVLRIAATTVAALPEKDARSLLGRALTIARSPIDPYGESGPMLTARGLVVTLLAERPELDDTIQTTLRLQAGVSVPAPSGGLPLELRLLALAVRERSPDSGHALIAAGVAAGISLADLERAGSLADQPILRPAVIHSADRGRSPVRAAAWAGAFVLSWLWPPLLALAVAAGAEGQSWPAVPETWSLSDGVVALALLATVNVFTVQLSAQRLPGVVARSAGQPWMLTSSYSCVVSSLLVLIGPEALGHGAARSWATTGLFAAFVMTLLLSILLFQKRTDAARATAAYVTATLPGARSAGRTFGRAQARAAVLRDALDSVPMITISPDEVQGEWRSLVRAPHRGILSPSRRDLRALLSDPAFQAGTRIRLFVGMGTIVRVGKHVAAIVPGRDHTIDRRLKRKVRRHLVVRSSSGVEDVRRGAVALVQLALDLGEAGDVGTAERVSREAVRLVVEHISAARRARAATFRRDTVRASACSSGLRADALPVQAERRARDDELAPIIPALREVLDLAARAHLDAVGRFEVAGNLITPLLDATGESDGAVSVLPFLVPQAGRGRASPFAVTELLRLAGVRALELGASDSFRAVLGELDRLAAQDQTADEAVLMTSILAATASGVDGARASEALLRVPTQVGALQRPPGRASAVRRRALWRVGAAALALGTYSVAVRAARLLRDTQDTHGVIADAADEAVLADEVLRSALRGGYLRVEAKDALANYGTFLVALGHVGLYQGGGHGP